MTDNIKFVAITVQVGDTLYRYDEAGVLPHQRNSIKVTKKYKALDGSSEVILKPKYPDSRYDFPFAESMLGLAHFKKGVE